MGRAASLPNASPDGRTRPEVLHYPLSADSRVEAQRADAVARRLNGERLVVLGWTRAILLQFGHPLIAAGVYDHSGFRSSPLAAARRLHHTIRAMLALSFGNDAEREQAIDGIRAIHRRVNGELRERVGPFPAGSRYSAEDPALVLWVHLTLIESIVLVYEQLVAPLTDQERDDYCIASAPVAVALGARPDAVPHRWRDVQESLARIYASGVISIGGEARLLAHAVIHPRGTAILRPVNVLNEVLTAGLLPAAIREAYGFQWTARRARTFDWIIATLRTFRHGIPDRLARWSAARTGSRTGRGRGGAGTSAGTSGR
jgi:uncharacterized protein (DUF2236 family)